MTWTEMTIAPEGTHHLLQGRPAYDQRFHRVLKYHPPGLAPVQFGEIAWHIDAQGSAAYPQRFLQTFGFYEGRAAVADSTGWLHILTDGTALYSERYAWCGNFQEQRCPVRRQDGAYVHLNHEGAPAYAQVWHYAGDFRDGVAVVQRADGLHTHIRKDGEPLHGEWFLDLDVFHKGHARARDHGGWHHVDVAGKALYSQRFAMVEPFYNGQARVERPDGGLEVVDQQGQLIAELRSPVRTEFSALSADMVGFWRTETIAAAVEVGLFEVLPASDQQVAVRCGLHVLRTGRLLRALAELSLVEAIGTEWQVTPRGAYLLQRHPTTLAGAAVEYARRFAPMWQQLPKVLAETDAWQHPDLFAEVATATDHSQRHSRMLLSYAVHDYAEVPEVLPLDDATHVIDAGGGLGALAAGIVAGFPGLRVTVLERPEVVALAMDGPFATKRLVFQAADLFAQWPVCADAVVLARVLHDWNDTKALEILCRARAALPIGGKIFVIEMALSTHLPHGALCDLHLLMATGGQERTVAAYTKLLQQAGFGVTEVRKLKALPTVVIGVAQ